mmetsp:Transcript_45120/g.125119  ORF Transcript_45120/g.125119 Transcript_45120/m.125119 type:complete len:114 (-) Transcript_45120:130-471(-)
MSATKVSFWAMAVVLLATPTVDGSLLRAMVRDCPLCVAEDNCHMACADVKSKSPGTRYCLEACTGAHPGEEFDQQFFERADKKAAERAALDASIKRLGAELAADVAARSAHSG